MILLIVPPIRPCRSLRPAPSAATPRSPRRAARAPTAPRRPGASPRRATGHEGRKASRPAEPAALDVHSGRVWKKPRPKTRAERAGADEPPLGSEGLASESGFAVRWDVVGPIRGGRRCVLPLARSARYGRRATAAR